MKQLIITTIAAVLLVGCDSPDQVFLRAAENGNIQIIQDYINSGGEINVRTPKGFTPLYLAACGGHLETMQILMENGAIVDEEAGGGMNPLMCACISGSSESVKFLIDNGAKINTTNELGATALHFAGHFGYSEIIKMLVENGADVNVVDKDGKAPLDSLTSRLKDIELIRKHGGKTSEELKSISVTTVGAKILDLSEVDIEPRSLVRTPAQYPPKLLLHDVKGQVDVSIVIDEEGDVRDYKVIRSSHDEFEREVMRVIQHWKFIPAIKDGKNIAVRKTQAFYFGEQTEANE